MVKKSQPESIVGTIIVFCLLTICFSFIYFDVFDNKVGIGMGLKCKSHTWFDKDKYCAEVCSESWGSICFSDSLQVYKLKSHKQDAIDESNRQIEAERQRKAQEESDRCYNAGHDYNYNFTIFGNYNLSCKKLAYINDHLIDSVHQLDGGYIKGSYSGFLSSGYVEGHLYQYVVTGVLATGQLMKSISYHIDCNNQTSGQIESYFTESEFVMGYVNQCIEEE